MLALDFADSRSDLEWKINFGGGVGEMSKSNTAQQSVSSQSDFEELDMGH